MRLLGHYFMRMAVLAGMIVWSAPASALPPSPESPRSPWHTLGTDETGDWNPGYVDITAVRVRQTSRYLVLRFDFRDLPAVTAPGGRVGAHLSRDGGGRKCCFVRGSLSVGIPHTMSYRKDPSCRGDGCWQETTVDGRYEHEHDRLVLFIPLRKVGFQRGDVLAGCPPPDGEGECAPQDNTVYTSPTAGMYGYDGVVITRPYRIR